MLEHFINFFQGLENKPVLRLAMLVGGLLFFWMLEGSIPLFKLKYKSTKFRHASINLVFTVLHLAIHTVLALVIIFLSDWCKANGFGLVHWMDFGVVATIITTVLMLDFFGGWLVHMVEHKVPFLWRFHFIHHSDNKVDVTTGLRHHPGESIVRGIFFFLGILASGAPMYAVMVFQTFLVFATAFTHANIHLGIKTDNFLSYFLVSPNMHKVHHHWLQPYTDSNYGAIFSIWDRLLGTFSSLNKEDIKYGLDKYYPNEEDENLWKLMKRPFEKLS